jgi:hypothetical protein
MFYAKYFHIKVSPCSSAEQMHMKGTKETWFMQFPGEKNILKEHNHKKINKIHCSNIARQL